MFFNKRKDSIPTVKCVNGVYEGTIKLEEWNSFFNTNKKIQLIIGGDEDIDGVTSLHKRTYDYLIENQRAILDNLLLALLAEYPTLQEEYDFDDEEKRLYMPDVDNAEDFKSLLVPETVCIFNVETDGIAYIGYHFLTKWDDEHGVGIMTHKQRVASIGDADEAFMAWVAEDDQENQ